MDIGAYVSYCVHVSKISKLSIGSTKLIARGRM